MLAVKQALQEKEGIQVDQIRLIHSGKQLYVLILLIECWFLELLFALYLRFLFSPFQVGRQDAGVLQHSSGCHYSYGSAIERRVLLKLVR